MKNCLGLKRGFTLAEVLIVLIIIGVLSSLIIPALISNTDKAEKFTVIKETYSILSQATNLVIQDKGGSLMGQFNNSDDIVNAFTKYLSVVKTCTMGNSIGQGNCFLDQMTFLNGQIYPSGYWAALTPYSSGIILSNGVIINIYVGGSGVVKSLTCGVNSNTNDCGEFVIDVNGWKGPNKIGVDIFNFIMRPNRIVPLSDDIDPTHPCVYPPSTGWNGANNQGWTCTSKVITGQI
jgi:prepilin-type N-terminal cleavage/methylation domain-containing protein